MELECDLYKQIEAMVSTSDSLLSQECKVEYVEHCITVNPHYIANKKPCHAT